MDIEKMTRYLIIFSIMLAFVSQAQGKDDRGLAVTQGGAGKRVALVIGNGAYQHPDNLPKLANPANDARDIATALRGFGFDVIEKKDLSLESMNDAIDEFSRKIGNSEAALFYFAGHGLQVKGQNYIIPVNAKIETEARVQYESVNVNRILDEMENGKSRVNIVMLDACRNNPISGKFRSGATRGLAAPSSQPKGTVIVYATDPGNVAADGDGRNGLFTAGLLSAFKGNDLSLAGVLTRASEEVERGSKQKQTPYVNGPMTLQKSFQFGQGTQVASLVPVPVPAQPAVQVRSKEQIEDDTWKTAEGINTAEAYETYLTGYPSGRYAVQAKMKLAALKKQPAPATKPEPVASAIKPEPAAKPAQAGIEAAARQEAERQRQQAEAAERQRKREEEAAQQEAERKRKQAKAPKGNYVTQGGLTWMPVSFYKTWAEANSYCASTAINGQSGWRLPTRDELVALYHSGAMKGQGWTLGLTWSSTPDGSGNHSGVGLDFGGVYSYNDTYSFYVTCVR